MLIREREEQKPEIAKFMLSRHRCVPEIASPGSDKAKTCYSTRKNAGEPGEQPGGEPGEQPLAQRVAYFRNSQLSITLVLADGSLKTHNLKLVGKSECTLSRNCCN